METRFSFSKEKLLALPLPQPGQRAIYHDTRMPGLQLRVAASGVKSFSVFRRIKGGAPERITLGRFPSMTVEQARNAAAALNAEIASGASPSAVKRAARAEPTFADAFEDFESHKRKRDGSPISNKTKRDYRDLLRLYMDGFAGRKLSAIERVDVRSLRERVNKKSPAQADKVVALVSAVYNHMKSHDRFSGANPAEGVQKNAPVQRDRFIQAREMPHFCRALAEGPTEAMRDFFLLALLTGLRRSNVAAMRWADVNLDEAVWRVEITKNGTPQNVALSPEAVEVLQARRRHKLPGDVYVFPSDSASGHIEEPKNAWSRVLMLASVFSLCEAMQLNDDDMAAVEDVRVKGLERALDFVRGMARAKGIDPAPHEVRNLRIHDLRRTLGSWQARAGASLTIIGKSLNHKTHQATAIYARLDLDPVRQSVNTATSAMLEAAGLKQGGEVLKLPIKKPRVA